MARIAQGNIAMLFPPGCDSVEDITNDLLTVIQFSSTVLSWQQNLTKEEQPPQWMWPFADEISEWFDEVDQLRKQKYSGGGGGGDDDDEWADMDSNAFAEDFD